MTSIDNNNSSTEIELGSSMLETRVNTTTVPFWNYLLTTYMYHHSTAQNIVYLLDTSLVILCAFSTTYVSFSTSQYRDINVVSRRYLTYM